MSGFYALLFTVTFMAFLLALAYHDWIVAGVLVAPLVFFGRQFERHQAGGSHG